MILITGNAGFIGKYLTSALIDVGYEVQGLDIRPRKDIEKGFIQIDGNILDKNIACKAMVGVDSIVHLAAEHKDFGISKEEYFKVTSILRISYFIVPLPSMAAINHPRTLQYPSRIITMGLRS